MKKNLYFLATFFIFAFLNVATAHPLGNFSINQYSRLEVEKNQIRLRSILDMAEIPTFQELQNIDADKNGQLSTAELNSYLERLTPNYLTNLRLKVDGVPFQFKSVAANITLPPGAGQLPTLRIEWDLVTDLPIDAAANALHKVSFENKNNIGRVGWNEIIVNQIAPVNVFDSNAFGSELSNELKTYPENMLTAPLAEHGAEFSYGFGALPPNAKPLQNRDGKLAVAVQKDKFAELINVPQITFSIALLGFLVAFGLGAFHAMSPGHGKTVVGAYLVGSRGTIKHAAFLGLTVTVTHTLGVFVLGLITLFASKYILPERLMPFLNFVSGLLVFFIGAALFKDRLFSALGWKNNHNHQHDNLDIAQDASDGFTHTHNGNTHSHKPPETVTWRSLLALGISGGLLPCPSALVLMLAAISVGRIGYGLILTLSFSLGLAATLMSVGLIFLYIGKIFDAPSLKGNRIIKTLPVFSAFVIACLGAVICYSSIN